MKVLVDTNIIIDVLQKRESFWEASYNVFMLAANHHIDALISAKEITDVYYLMHKYTHSDKASRDILIKLIQLFGVESTMDSDCINALTSPMKDYEDAVMAEMAKRSGARCIITRNTKDYALSPVPAITPDELIRQMEQR